MVALVVTASIPGTAPAGTAGDPVRTLQTTTSTGRRGVYYLPTGDASRPSPVLVFLHGTGGRGTLVMSRLRALAELKRTLEGKSNE